MQQPVFKVHACISPLLFIADLAINCLSQALRVPGGEELGTGCVLPLGLPTEQALDTLGCPVGPTAVGRAGFPHPAFGPLHLRPRRRAGNRHVLTSTAGAGRWCPLWPPAGGHGLCSGHVLAESAGLGAHSPDWSWTTALSSSTPA